jgi:hypothetical protein
MDVADYLGIFKGSECTTVRQKAFGSENGGAGVRPPIKIPSLGGRAGKTSPSGQL